MKLLLALAVVSLCVAGSEALLPRQKAPDFKTWATINEKFQRISLSDYDGQWRVLVFFPFAFTFTCPTEILSFSDRVDEFKAINAQVFAISTDSHHTHLAWMHTPRSQGGIKGVSIPLVADIGKTISRNYGVLVEDETDDMFGAALRGLIVIDPKGVVRAVTVYDDAVGRSTDEALRLIKAFEFADENGQVCPANWQPGEPTITPDPEAAMSYFEQANNGKEL